MNDLRDISRIWLGTAVTLGLAWAFACLSSVALARRSMLPERAGRESRR